MHILEFAYHLGFSAKKNWYTKRRKRLPSKVISIGNLTVGGTGKTPAVIAVAEQAKIRGFRPVILTRGYKGKAAGPCFVSKGQRPLMSAAQAGDEPRLMAKKLEGVPVIKASDRYEGGILALNEIGNKPRVVFILDDGFQHFRLHRDVDVLLIDAFNPFGNRKLLPFGPLREPLEGAGRAQIIVFTNRSNKNPDCEGIIKEIRMYNRTAPVFFSRHVPVGLRLGSGEAVSLNTLSGKKIFAFCGLGTPDGFLETIRDLGAQVAEHRFFRDHHAYTREDLSAVEGAAKGCGAEWIVTTEKDIMKLDVDLPENILIIEIEFSVQAGFYDKVFAD